MKQLRASAAALSWLLMIQLPAHGDGLHAGFGKADITPLVPMRLSGYANRDKPCVGVETKLWARALAIRGPDGRLFVLANADAIGVPATLTDTVAARIEKIHAVTRDRFVFCVTHSHTAPHIIGYAPNIFRQQLSDEERHHHEAYATLLVDRIVAAVGQAIKGLRAARLLHGEGHAHVAANRRVLRDGKWAGFGVQKNGPTDPSLPILKVTTPDDRLLGVVFNYACHCTTLGPNFNKVCGDWAGFAQETIEQTHPGAVAICTIGCGADANPEPRGELDMAEAHGRAIAGEVERLLASQLRQLNTQPITTFGMAGLAIDRPSTVEITRRLLASDVHQKRHAQEMEAITKRMGRMPESYPCPVQVWRFGNQLTMVFLGGEVVVDYALRLKKELKADSVWVTAYANDVFGYVASERMREEGGYEVDASMIYYNIPGRWSAGAETALVRRVHELAGTSRRDAPKSAQEALESFRLPDGLSIELVASEPLVADPINIAFADDGRLWVVEMGDYPRGADDRGAPGGRIKLLRDSDGDGTFDQATTYLDGLHYPTGAMPWRGGVLIAAAPKILFAEDTNGDDKADRTQTLFEGFLEANPQHRVHGFTYGLDNWVYIGGDNGGAIRSTKTGQVVNMSGRDARIQPDEGVLETVTGQSQFIRCRDDWGEWFGNNNSLPLAHFVLPDHYLRRNRHVATISSRVELLRPPLNPPVFPASRTLDRFNDVHTANRFTSACSPEIYRADLLGDDFRNIAFVCEPVHNLVHRIVLKPDGVTFTGARHIDDEQSEFLASTDNWFRPVRAMTGPDGALWIVDMYRQVIEHPEWIPESWQRHLDLRAGHDKGRVYRVYPKGRRPGPLPALSTFDAVRLVHTLNRPEGALRDAAQRLLVHRGDRSIVPQMRERVSSATRSESRVQALWTLEGLDGLTPDLLSAAMDDGDPHVRAHAVRLSERFLPTSPPLGHKIATLAADKEKRVRLQSAFSLGHWHDPAAAIALGRLLAVDLTDSWIRAAVISSSVDCAQGVLAEALAQLPQCDEKNQIVESLIRTALGGDARQGSRRLLNAVLPDRDSAIGRGHIAAVAAICDQLRRQNIDIATMLRQEDGDAASIAERFARVVAFARRVAIDDAAAVTERVAAVRLTGVDPSGTPSDLTTLAPLLRAHSPPDLQNAVVATLSQSRSEKVPQLLLTDWRGHGPMLRGQILEVLLSRDDWTEQLLAAIERRSLSVADLDTARQQRITQHRRPELRERANRLFGGAPLSDRKDVMRTFAEALSLKGELVHGGDVFARHCAACHRFRGLGTELGPDIAALKDKSAAALLDAILDPNKAVETKYRSYSASLDDGRVLTGMVVEESATSIVLARQDGTKVSILRSELSDLAASNASFMPEGLEKQLSARDLADLFVYLRSAPAPIGDRTAGSTGPKLADFGIGDVHVIDATATDRQPSFLGTVDMRYCRAFDGKGVVVWEATARRSRNPADEPAIFRIPVAMGYFSQPAAVFRLSINGERALDLTPSPGDGYWTTPGGDLRAFYCALQVNDEDSTGVLQLSMHRGRGDFEKPVRFEISGAATNSLRWFGLLVPRDK